ncbi:hypothetical protein [Bacillus cytotoxicus]|uniref:hypothetical protein n=1 Tax=Bacillus cytotoxicus TaxID=580165 RepID=UPI003D7EBE43
MDVHYKSKHWQQMKDGINEITKDAITNLRQADELLEDIQERIQDLDSDRCIDFYHRKQEKKINTLLEDYTTLQNYCDKAGQVVYEHIDEPFYKKMDEFAQTMRDISIRDFQTKNRIGATTTTTLPSSHAYGVPQTITTKKEKITVDDIFKDSLAFDHVLRAQYKEVKKQNPDAKLNYKEYRQLVPSMRGFEYTSIEDEQKKLEAWRDVAISGALIITTIFCPPLGIAASVVYGGLQVKSAIEGEDWGTRRKLSKEEQVEAGFFGALDLVPGLGSATKAFKGTIDLGSLAKLTKWKEGIADFNPNIGENVVQSLKENETLKNALHTWKKTKVPVAIRSADTGMGIKIPHIEHATVGEIAENFARVRATAKEDAYQLAKGNGGSGVKGTGEALGNKKVAAGEEIIAQRVLKAELDLTPKLTPYKSLSRGQQKKIKEKIENRTVTKEEYKRYQWDKRFSKRRAAGVNEFWKQEKKRILDGESTTRDWTNEQIQEILKGKKPQYNGKSIIGHHTYNAMNYPHICNRGELIYPVTGREHLKGWHGGSYSKNAPGRPVNPNYLEEF